MLDQAQNPYQPPGDGTKSREQARPKHPPMPRTMSVPGLPPVLARLHRKQMLAIRQEREQREDGR